MKMTNGKNMEEFAPSDEGLSLSKIDEILEEMQQHYANVACNLKEMEPDQKWLLYLSAGKEKDGRMRKRFPAGVADTFLCKMEVKLSLDSMRAYFQAMTTSIPESDEEERIAFGQLTPVQEIQLDMLDSQMGRDAFVACFQKEHAGGLSFGRCRCTVKGDPKNPNIQHFAECWKEFFGEPLTTQSYRNVDMKVFDEEEPREDAMDEIPFSMPEWTPFHPKHAATPAT